MNLSSEERRTLESMARKYTSPYCDVVRAKIILLADEGHTGPIGKNTTLGPTTPFIFRSLDSREGKEKLVNQFWTFCPAHNFRTYIVLQRSRVIR